MRKLIHSCLLLSIIATAGATETVTVVMSTSAGTVVIELYPDAAPVTVANFLEYVDGDRYRNSFIYRVVRMDNQAQNNIKIEVIQGGLGDAEEELSFDPIVHETTESTGILHTDGVISMARLEPGSATSEFFICVNDQPDLDFGGQRNPDGQGFAAFGKVVKGMNVIREIQNMNTDPPPEGELEYTSGQMLLDPVVIFGINRTVYPQ
jgi:peptidyl-prolyl cis-trans isomerase A (cyclophilin A)